MVGAPEPDMPGTDFLSRYIQHRAVICMWMPVESLVGMKAIFVLENHDPFGCLANVILLYTGVLQIRYCEILCLKRYMFGVPTGS
jgi:hypothetical protein